MIQNQFLDAQTSIQTHYMWDCDIKRKRRSEETGERTELFSQNNPSTIKYYITSLDALVVPKLRGVSYNPPLSVCMSFITNFIEDFVYFRLYHHQDKKTCGTESLKLLDVCSDADLNNRTHWNTKQRI